MKKQIIINLALIAVIALSAMLGKNFDWLGVGAFFILCFLWVIYIINILRSPTMFGLTGGEIIGWVGNIFFVVIVIAIMFSSEKFSGSIGGLLGSFLFLIFWNKFWFSFAVKEDKTNPFNQIEFASFLNPKKLIKGYKWSTYKQILDKFSKTEKSLMIDNFTISDEVKENKPNTLSIPQALKDTKSYFDRLNFTKTILSIGGMGSGKTEFFNSILNQNKDFDFFKREILHDVKGDFTHNFYDEKTDFIFNPYDERGVKWDIWTDMKSSETLVLSFITNLIEYHMKEKDFFSSASSKILSDFFMKTHFSNPQATSSEKWVMLLNEISKYEAECEDDRTKASIYANMELTIETFKLFAWQSTQTNLKSFTLTEFLDNSNSRLILLNNASYSKKLYPLFTGFVAMMIEMMLSKSDTKDDLSLILLDEYLSMKFDEDIRLKLQTQIRSKGGCLMLGVQYIDMSNKKAKQLMDSSKYAMMVFSTSDGETVKHICDSFGQISYEKTKVSKSNTSGLIGDGNTSNSTSTSVEDKQEHFITPKHIQSMPEYHHLTLLPSENTFYLGYTPLVELNGDNQTFIKRDLAAYYEFAYNANNTAFEKVNVKSEDDIYTFAQKRKIYLEFTKLDEKADNFNDELDKLIKNYALEDINLDEFFKEVM